MDSKISSIRNLFSVQPTYTSTKRSTDRDADGRQEQKQRDRQPTEEEAKRALEVLMQMDSVAKNGLIAALEFVEGIYVIHVRNGSGQALRSLRGMEILRLLDNASAESPSLIRGSILDRRI